MIDAGFGHWFAGFTDGEGCFWIHRQKSGTYFAPQFKIKLRADDRDTLVMCQTKLGIGNIYDHAASTANGRNANPGATWHVQSTADVDVIVDVFDRYPLRAKKARDFEVWRRAVVVSRAMTRGNRWHGPRNWSPLLLLKTELETGRRYKELPC